jgi:hypothetical protein
MHRFNWQLYTQLSCWHTFQLFLCRDKLWACPKKLYIQAYSIMCGILFVIYYYVNASIIWLPSLFTVLDTKSYGDVDRGIFQ